MKHITFTYLCFRLDFTTNFVDTCEQTATAHISQSKETKSSIFTDINYVFPGTVRLQFAEAIDSLQIQVKLCITIKELSLSPDELATP